MYISVSRYADLLLVTDKLRTKPIVFYSDRLLSETPPAFYISVVVGELGINTTTSSKPATFDTDFPDAVALEFPATFY